MVDVGTKIWLQDSTAALRCCGLSALTAISSAVGAASAAVIKSKASRKRLLDPRQLAPEDLRDAEHRFGRSLDLDLALASLQFGLHGADVEYASGVLAVIR